MFLSPGTVLGGQYRIIRYIAHGGFGCTYEAEHIYLRKNNHVAIKEFFPSTFCDREEGTKCMTINTENNKETVLQLKKKFIDEANTVAELDYPGIVKIRGVFEENNTAYFVMDYIDGPSLSQMLKTNGVMSEQEALNYIRQVADTLRYVHSQGRLHLDVKPANILVPPDGRPVLIDFGVSKQYHDGSGYSRTIQGYSLGYAPSEQMNLRIESLCEASDIYSLGATLYCLLTGEPPVESGVLEYPHPVSENVQHTIERCLETKTHRRPQNIDEFLAMLGGEGASQPSYSEAGATQKIDPVTSDRTQFNDPGQGYPASGGNYPPYGAQPYAPGPNLPNPHVEEIQPTSSNSLVKGIVIVSIVAAALAVLMVILVVALNDNSDYDSDYDYTDYALETDSVVAEYPEAPAAEALPVPAAEAPYEPIAK